MRLRMAAASLAALTLLAAGTAVAAPAVAGTTRRPRRERPPRRRAVAAESGYIDTEPGGRVFDSTGGTPVGHRRCRDGQYVSRSSRSV